MRHFIARWIEIATGQAPEDVHRLQPASAHGRRVHAALGLLTLDTAYFNRPPHAGPLHYERFDWGINGEQWRALADRAARELGLE